MSETRKYFEHITGKSERVLPTEPGWWWSTAGDAIAVLEVHRNRNGELCVSDPEHKEWRVDNVAFTWLEPVAPLGTAARLAAAEADVSHARHVIHGTGQLGASLREEVELVAEALAQTRNMLSAAEAELAELKQRIAAATVAWAVVDEKTERVIGVCNHEYDAVTLDAKTTQSHVVQVRLLEVRDGE